MRALTRAQVVQQANDAGRGLVGLVLHFPQTSDGPAHASLTYVVYARQGGFMVVVPGEEDLESYIEELDRHGSEERPAFRLGSAALETSRGRALGEGPVLLVDFPWSMLEHFSNVAVLKSATMADMDVAQWSVEGTAARPSKLAVRDLADAWITSGLGETEAQEYLTGEEIEELDVQNGPSTSANLGPQDPTSEVASLRARLAELEGRLSTSPVVMQTTPKAAPPQPVLQGPGKAAGLFAQASESGLTAPELTRLQNLAGVAPPRIAGAETRRRQVPAATIRNDGLLSEMEKEVVDPAEQEGLISQDLAAVTDPFQKMLLAQMQQNQLLMQRMLSGKNPDPVLGALTTGGGDNASGSSSGVKGCLAREAFVKVVADNHKLAEIVRINALRELGMDPSREDGSLMRRYIERRIPLADHRLLAHFATLLAEAWATGHASNNVELLGVVGRMLIFTEQVAIDSGKLQVGWLLTGVAEPPLHLMTTRQKHPGLQPFSRLSAPGWVAANLAYLRDLDFLESRVAASNKPNPNIRKETDKEDKPPPKGAGKNKKKKGQGQEDEVLEQ